tara:strand:+ start:959 stop:1300 length:342 start_codon:yes stop_codon:yes gene_type:complete
MTNFNWCHGPNCHKKELQSRVRGSKGNKVLRTMKVKIRSNNNYWFQHWWNYFCNQSCLMEFVQKHIQGMIALEPRKEPLETRIDDPKKETESTHWGTHTRTIINKIDNENNVG